MNKLIMMIGAAAVAIGAYAAEYTYTGGAVSPADGKVAILCNNGGAVTNLMMSPSVGETLTLTGDTLSFADGAQIIGSRHGEARIANSFTAAGTLNFGPARETFDYSGEFLPSNVVNAVVVAANADLEDIEIVSAKWSGTGGTINGFSQNVDFLPHHVSLSGGKLTAQMTSGTATMTRCVKIELWQNGADVVCRAVYAAYINEQNEDNDFDVNAVRRDWRMATKESVAQSTAAGKKLNGYGFDTLTLRTKTAGVTFLVDGTLNISTPVAGSNVAVTFEAASATATVNVTAQNSMTDSAYIIKGDADHVMKFYAEHASSPYYPLPSGTTDAYGEGTELHIYGYNKMGNGTSGGESAITMHLGSKLYAENKSHAFYRGKQVLTLDAAELEIDNTTYVPKTLTLANGSTVSVSGSATLSAVYDQNGVVMNVTGTGASTFNPDVTLFSNNATKREWEICVDDTVSGDDVDFIFNGDVNLSSTANQQNSIIKKTGVGTMRMNGQMKYVNNATRICEGTLLLGKSDATVSGAKFSLEGGTLGLAANTANTVSSVAVTADSAISFGAGATLTVTTLTLGNEVNTLSITGADGEYPIRISNRLDAETLAKIRLNGKRVVQASNGRLVRRGLIISVF